MDLGFLLFVAFVSFGVGFVVGLKLGDKENNDLMAAAIEHGFARYHPKTGEWEWIEPEAKE